MGAQLPFPFALERKHSMGITAGDGRSSGRVLDHQHRRMLDIALVHLDDAQRATAEWDRVAGPPAGDGRKPRRIGRRAVCPLKLERACQRSWRAPARPSSGKRPSAALGRWRWIGSHSQGDQVGDGAADYAPSWPVLLDEPLSHRTVARSYRHNLRPDRSWPIGRPNPFRQLLQPGAP